MSLVELQPDASRDAIASHAEAPVLFGVFQTGMHANGGVESVTQLIENLHAPMIVLSQAEMPVNARWRAAGCDVVLIHAPHALPTYRRLTFREKIGRVLSHVSANWTTYRLVRRFGVRAVHCNDAAAFWHMAAGAALAGARPIYNVRGVLEADAVGGLRRLKWRLKFAASREVIVLSEEMKAFFIDVLALGSRTAAKIRVVPSIVDHERLAPLSPRERTALRKRLGIDPATFAVGYIATFNPNKQQDLFLAQAAPRLRKSGKVQCFFLGDFDTDRNVFARDCRRLIETHALEGVAHCRGVTDEVHNWYRALDAVVLASRREGLARCMIEGMAAGLPIVTFDVCSAHETIEASGGGVVVRQGDFEGLARELLRLAENPAEAAAMGRSGRAYARSVYDGAAVAAAYRRAYGQADA